MENKQKFTFDRSKVNGNGRSYNFIQSNNSNNNNQFKENKVPRVSQGSSNYYDILNRAPRMSRGDNSAYNNGNNYPNLVVRY